MTGRQAGHSHHRHYMVYMSQPVTTRHFALTHFIRPTCPPWEDLFSGVHAVSRLTCLRVNEDDGHLSTGVITPSYEIKWSCPVAETLRGQRIRAMVDGPLVKWALEVNTQRWSLHRQSRPSLRAELQGFGWPLQTDTNTLLQGCLFTLIWLLQTDTNTLLQSCVVVTLIWLLQRSTLLRQLNRSTCE